MSENVNSYTGNDGSIDVSVEGGSPPYYFLWNNGEITEDINGLEPGVYQLTVTNDNCNMETADFFIDYLPIQISCSTTESNSNGASTLSIEIFDGTAPYTININDAEYTQDNEGIFEVENLTIGEYNVIVSDAFGNTTECESTIFSEYVHISTCQEGCVTIGKDAGNFSWDGAMSDLDNPNASITEACPDSNAEYVLTIFDGQNNIDEIIGYSITIENPQARIEPENPVLCYTEPPSFTGSADEKFRVVSIYE